MKLFMGNTIKKQNQVLEHQKKQEEYAKYLKEVVPTLGNTTNNNTMNINIYLNEYYFWQFQELFLPKQLKLSIL